MASTESFSSSGEAVISRKIDILPCQKTSKSVDIDTVCELQKCVTWIKSRGFTRVALQFPDEMLHLAVAVVTQLQTRLDNVKVFILGDTSYGSCCVDEVAAQHYVADSIIHFGHSCLSPTRRLPVLYIFGQEPLDVEDCAEQISKLLPDPATKLILMYETVYHYAVGCLSERLSKQYKNLVLSHLVIPGEGCPDSEGDKPLKQTEQSSDQSDNGVCCLCKCGRKFVLSKQTELVDFAVLYIGGESATLTNLIFSFKECPFFTYNPRDRIARKENVNVNKLLMKRYFMIERAKDANIVGILIGTLGVSHYLDILSRLQELLKIAGKKSYTFVVGKINVPKLANFMEVDVFVLVACPENTLLDSSEFYKPVVTPYEMEIACNANQEWTADFITDFHQILPGGSHFVELSAEDGLTTDVSLISGRLRTIGTEDTPETGTMILPRSETMAVTTVQAHSAGEYLSSRSWQGLEKKTGETPIVKAVEGQHGIAMGYVHEGEPST